MIVPFSPPDIGEDEVRLVCEALTSGWITTGPKTKEFEKRISEYCGTRKTVCLNSATACLETTLRVLGIGRGDEVITSAYTYTASASVIEHVGACPVLVDVEEDGFFISPKKVREAVTERTKAIIVVDYAGVPVNPAPFYDIIMEKKDCFKASSPVQKAMGRIALVADGAHSIGASLGGIKTGGLCDFTCFSFHAVKNLTTAEGGAVTWRDMDGVDMDELYRQYMLYSLHGQSKDALAKTKKGQWRYDIEVTGYKCNMTDIMAALGLAQLGRYDSMLRRRRELVTRYDNAFKDRERLMPLSHLTDGYQSSCHLYPVRIKGISEEQRDAVITELAERGVTVNVHYIPLPMMTAYKKMGFDIKDFPCAYNTYKNEITLPLFSAMTEEQQEYVIKNFLEVTDEICS